MPTSTITVEIASPESIAPFGWLLGEGHALPQNPIEFRSPSSDFWHEHLFDPGPGGDTEVVWVTYRDADSPVSKLEVHHLTQQAVVPLTKSIVQVLCLSDEHDEHHAPDLSTLRAFHLPPGIGICMRPGVWHATRADNAMCLMLTRRSTTMDLVAHLSHKHQAKESASSAIPPLHLLGGFATQ